MSMTQDITKAAKELSSLERKLEKIVANEKIAVAKATAKAELKYTVKVNAIIAEVADSKLRLQTLVASA